MVNFTIDQVRSLMDKKKTIRNMSVIAHVDHGKTTLTDSLVAAAGIIASQKAGDACYTDTREDEQLRGITIKSTGVSLFYSLPKWKQTLKESIAAMDYLRRAESGEKMKKKKKEEKKEAAVVIEEPEEGNDFLINLVDSPGHVDFSSEVTAALRVTDGALVVVDCIEGVCVQTETVLRQAIGERIKPILFVNKIDRALLELQLENEDAYCAFEKAVESVNVVIEQFKDELLGDVQVHPVAGTVGFGSALQTWGFTLATFADMYASKYGIDNTKMRDRMWGSHFLDPKTKKWVKQQYDSNGKKLIRGFVHYIMKPIKSLVDAIMNDKKEIWEGILEKLVVKVPAEAKNLSGKHLLKCIMHAWLPAEEALLQMIVVHLPSPVTAQRYRVKNLYTGDMDDECAKAIQNCDPDGPLMMYISKMVPTSDRGRFFAFGRVFSGTVRSNQSVNILGPEYEVGSKTDFYQNKKVQRTVLMQGRSIDQLADCPCGNIVGLVGIDTFLLKSGTITTSDNAFPFRQMKFSVSPVVRCAVSVKNSQDLPKLVEGLKRLGKSDPLVQITNTAQGEHIVAGAGELHLEICLKDLADDYMRGAPITISDPVVSFCETVCKTSEKTVVCKSSNKHNRVYLTAEPLEDGLVRKIEAREIREDDKDPKKRTRMLVDEFKWTKTDAVKIWAFGCPPDGRGNVFVDCTKGASFLNEAKDHIVNGFIQATAAGVLMDEPWRAVRVNLVDITLHTDAIHRGAGQLSPTARRSLFGVQLVSGPRIMEPVYLCDITVPQDKISGCYSTLATRRGKIIPDEDETMGPLAHVKAYLPVLESFGFASKLRQATAGKAFPQMIFDHWDIVDGDNEDANPMTDERTRTHTIMMDVRKRKGLKMEIPVIDDYFDKIN